VRVLALSTQKEEDLTRILCQENGRDKVCSRPKQKGGRGSAGLGIASSRRSEEEMAGGRAADWLGDHIKAGVLTY